MRPLKIVDFILRSLPAIFFWLAECDSSLDGKKSVSVMIFDTPIEQYVDLFKELSSFVFAVLLSEEQSF